LRVHFGLGNLERVDSVEISWPAGNVEILNNLVADHFYKVKEGKGIVVSMPVKAKKMIE
jgi:hypothetical protein